MEKLPTVARERPLRVFGLVSALAMRHAVGASGRQESAVWLGAVAVAAGGAAVLAFAEWGPLSLRMLQHLLLMNVAAPMLAIIIGRRLPAGRADSLWAAGLLQMALIWAWHAPIAQHLVVSSPWWDLVATSLLLVVALWFWRAVLTAAAAGGWGAVGALLLTGKLACLLGGLLVFAPRDLYVGLPLPWCGEGATSLADQQLAGLLMIIACPTSYLVAGATIAFRLLAGFDGNDGADVARRTV